jgi:hypothetical protein
MFQDVENSPNVCKSVINIFTEKKSYRTQVRGEAKKEASSVTTIFLIYIFFLFIS